MDIDIISDKVRGERSLFKEIETCVGITLMCLGSIRGSGILFHGLFFNTKHYDERLYGEIL